MIINEGNGSVINGDNIIHVEINENQPLDFSPDVAGGCPFKLTIKNDEGTTNADEVTIQVDDRINSIPVADTHHRVNAAVNLSAAKSYDADGDELSYQWFLAQNPVQVRRPWIILMQKTSISLLIWKVLM